MDIVRRVEQRLALRFSDPEIERAYQFDRRDRAPLIVRGVLLLGLATYALFGIWDVTSPTGGLSSTRFRFLVACPFIFLFLMWTYTARMRRHWERWTFAFMIVVGGLIAVSVELFNRETRFGTHIGNATLNFVLMQSFIALIPFSVRYAVSLGLIVEGIHALSVATGPDVESIVRLFYAFHLQCVFIVTTIVMARREWLDRKEFWGRYRLGPSPADPTIEHRVLPSAVAAHAEISVIFVDVVGFTYLTEKLAPRHTVEILVELFAIFDELAQRFDVVRVKTIGDGYMAVSTSAEGASRAADFALSAVSAIQQFGTRAEYGLQLRIGIHTGSAIGGRVGLCNSGYDYWGRTVNVAKRLESASKPGRVHISESTYWRLRTMFDVESRGRTEFKGVGPVETYFLLGRK